MKPYGPGGNPEHFCPDVAGVQHTLPGGFRIRNKNGKRRVAKKSARRSAIKEIQLDLFEDNL